MIKRISFIVAVSLLFASLVSAGDKEKIGIVDFMELIDNSEAGSLVKTKVKEKGEALQAELNESQADLKKIQQTYKRESALWTEKQRREKQESFQIMLNEFKKLQLQNTKEFNEFRSELFNELKEKLVKYLETKSKDEGYALIIEKKSGEVLYANPSFDITKDIVKHYDNIAKE
jgi:outer membrane protein